MHVNLSNRQRSTDWQHLDNSATNMLSQQLSQQRGERRQKGGFGDCMAYGASSSLLYLQTQLDDEFSRFWFFVLKVFLHLRNITGPMLLRLVNFLCLALFSSKIIPTTKTG